MGEPDLHFVLGDKLPYAFEVVTSILSCAPGGNPYERSESQKRKKTINAYVRYLIEIWSKAFGPKYIAPRKTVTNKIRKLLIEYHQKVTTKNLNPASKRSRRTAWRQDTNYLFIILKSTVDPEKFDEDERIFFNGQNHASRSGYISDKIDEDYTAAEELVVAEQLAEEQRLIEERAFIEEEGEPIDYEATASSSNSGVQLEQSVNRSGLTRSTVRTEDKCVQADIYVPSRKPIRNVRDCSSESKETCSQLSAQCGISVEMSRLAFIIVCKYYFGIVYYLDVETARKEEPTASNDNTHVSSAGDSGEDPPTKKRILSSKSDYADYRFVVPSSKTISATKQFQSIEEERKAAVALYTKPENIKTTFHFDTTSRSCIDGEWPALILIFSDNRRFNLRPIFFAYEDRENIACLVIETYNRLAIAASISTAEGVTAVMLWEKTTSFMTDSATKNLYVNELVAKYLNSSHVPWSLLCKSHCVEALDRSNLFVLALVEKQLGMKEKLEGINPALRSFFRGEKAVVVAGIKCLLNLVTHEKSATATNIADEFDFIVERENQVKHITLYHERRFCKLGYVCAALIDASPMLQMLLTETAMSNLHIESSKLYLECEFFFTELTVLAYFTHKVSLPLLNCVEVCGQEELLDILPRLYQDLSAGSMNTLEKYMVIYKHVPVKPESELSELERRLLLFMCKHAAESIKLQCGREYGFGDPGDEKRGKDLTELTPEELFGLPTNNLVCERWLSVFGKRSVVGKFRNKNFQAKGIRADLVLHKAQCSKVETVTKQVSKILNKREESWTAEQKELQKKKIEKKHSDGRRHDLYVDKLLKICKHEWNGPCLTGDELMNAIATHPDLTEKIVTTELSYYRHTHRADMIARPDLFQLRKVRHV